MIVGISYKKVAEMSTRMNRAEMGVATPTSFQNKKTYFEFLSHFEARNLEKIKAGALSYFDTSAKANASHPINEAVQGIGYYSDIISELQANQIKSKQNL